MRPRRLGSASEIDADLEISPGGTRANAIERTDSLPPRSLTACGRAIRGHDHNVDEDEDEDEASLTLQR